MEWNLINILVTTFFVLIANCLHLLIKLHSHKKLRTLWSILQFITYIAIFCFVFAQGATREQTLVILLLSLPAAFINIGKESKDGI